MKRNGSLFFTSALICIAGCSSASLDENLKDGVFTTEEWKKVQELSPLPEKPFTDTTNKYGENETAATFGQKLFYSSSFAGPIIKGDDGKNGGLGAAGDMGKVACSSCHAPPWFVDKHSNPPNLTLGTDWIPRNTPSLVNIAYFKGFHDWEGISDTLWVDGMGGAENPAFVGTSRLAIAHGLYSHNKAEYDALFDEPLDPALDPAASDASRFPAAGAPKQSPDAPNGDWEKMAPEDQKIVNRIFSNYGKAIAAFLTKLNSNHAPFDKYVAGDTSAISDSAKHGLKLFVGKANCFECHKGPYFSDEKYHNTTKVSKYPDTVVPGSADLFKGLSDFFDMGHTGGIGYATTNPLNRDGDYSDDTTTPLLKGLAATDADQSAYRTSPLRNITETGPYMHDGEFQKLEDVMTFYNDGGSKDAFTGTKDKLMKKLNLTKPEVADVLEFLKTLTGEPVDESLTH